MFGGILEGRFTCNLLHQNNFKIDEGQIKDSGWNNLPTNEPIYLDYFLIRGGKIIQFTVENPKNIFLQDFARS